MHKRWFLMPLAALWMVTIAGQAMADTSKDGKAEEAEGPHLVELFLGATHEEGEDGFSVGLAYEYRLHEFVGLGVFTEYTAGTLDSWVIGVPLFLHPYMGFRFLVAPGVEIAEGEADFLFRTGLAYEFEIGRWSITPEFNVDFKEGERAVVYGVSFGFKF